MQIQLMVIMHVYYCLHWITSTCLLFQNAFCQSCKFMTGNMVLIDDSKLKVRIWYYCHRQYNNYVLLHLVVEYWPILGLMDIMVTLNSVFLIIIKKSPKSAVIWMIWFAMLVQWITNLCSAKQTWSISGWGLFPLIEYFNMVVQCIATFCQKASHM